MPGCTTCSHAGSRIRQPDRSPGACRRRLCPGSSRRSGETLDLERYYIWAYLALAYHLASRLAYVLGVGVALARQWRHQSFTRRDGAEAGFRRFRRVAATLMNNDAVSFVLLCVVTRQTAAPVTAEPVAMAAGALLIALGVSTKLWAARQLGSGAYYWQDFFTGLGGRVPEQSGPYRYLKNPMYTVGYLHAYGLALLCGSLPGLAAAAFDQAAILVFWRLVEKPHFESLARVPFVGGTDGISIER